MPSGAPGAGIDSCDRVVRAGSYWACGFEVWSWTSDFSVFCSSLGSCAPSERGSSSTGVSGPALGPSTSLMSAAASVPAVSRAASVPAVASVGSCASAGAASVVAAAAGAALSFAGAVASAGAAGAGAAVWAAAMPAPNTMARAADARSDVLAVCAGNFMKILHSAGEARMRLASLDHKSLTSVKARCEVSGDCDALPAVAAPDRHRKLAGSIGGCP